MAEFTHRVEPFSHQRREFEEARELAYRALFWEQGTAKTKPMIDLATHLYLEGKINGVLIVAPNGVDENWVTDQIPEHMPVEIQPRSEVLLYRPEKRQTKWHMTEVRRAIHLDADRLSWLCIPYDTYISKGGKKIVWEFLKRRRCLYVLDESSNIKSPSAKRTGSIIASGVYAPYRRVLEGTPISLAPFDVYAQVRFLDPEFWKRELEIGTAVEFRQYFGIFQKNEKKDGTSFETCIGYKRLDQLKALIQKLGSRYLKADVLDLPPKLYGKVYCELNKTQRDVYTQLRDELMAELPSGRFVTTPLPITKMLRLQQISCGYVPVDDPTGDDPQPTELLGPTNPRLDLAVSRAQAYTHQIIIWARFHRDLDLLRDALGKDRSSRYDGTVDAAEKQRGKEAFLRGDVQFMLANPQAMGRGHTFTNAKSTLYYNNSHRLIDRLQSEDRNHRAGTTTPVDYTDIVARGTVDAGILTNLRKKHEVAAVVMGDELKEWI